MHPDVIKRKLRNVCGVRVMVQLLRTPAALAEGLGLIPPNTYDGLPPCNSSPGDLDPSSGLCGYRTQVVHKRACRQNTNTHKINHFKTCVIKERIVGARWCMSVIPALGGRAKTGI